MKAGWLLPLGFCLALNTWARPARHPHGVHAITARAYWLIADQPGRPLAQRDGDRALPPASLTKLMTAYVVFAAIQRGQVHPSQMVMVSRHAARQTPSVMGLREGERVTVNTLLHGMLIHSGNDAAVALAEAVGGSEAAFARQMNRTAAGLGMRHSHFINPTGLNAAGHYASAHDIAILASALRRRFPQYNPLYAQRYYVFHGRHLVNHNHQLGQIGIDGMKTGYTPRARYCIAISARGHGRRLIAVVMGAPTLAARSRDVRHLLRDG